MSTTTFSYASNVYPQNVFVEKSEQNLMGIPSPVLFEAMTQSDRDIHCLHMTLRGGWGGMFGFSKTQQHNPASVAWLDAPSDWRPEGRRINPRRGRQHSFVEIDHEIFSTVILSLPLIQEGQLSVSGERMCTILVNRLED